MYRQHRCRVDTQCVIKPLRSRGARTAVVIVLSLFAILSSSHAAGAPQPGPSAVKGALLAAKPDATNPATDLGGSDLPALIESAKREAATIEASPRHAAGAPSVATDDELGLRRYYVRETVRAYEQQKRSLQLLATQRRESEETRQRNLNWPGFDTPPPYSILLVDRLVRDEAEASNTLEVFSTRKKAIDGFREFLSNATQDAASHIRQLEEEVAQASSVDTTALRWKLELFRKRLQMQTAMLRSFALSDDLNALATVEAQSEADLAKRKLLSAQATPNFTESDYRAITQSLELENRRVADSLGRALDQQSNTIAELDGARQALLESRAAKELGDTTPPDEADIESRNLAVKLAEARVRNANSTLDAVRMMPPVMEMKRVAWELRFRLYHERSAQLVADAKQKLKPMSDALGLFSGLLDRQIAALRNETGELDKQLSSNEEKSTRALFDQQLAVLAERDNQTRQIALLVSSTQALINRLESELTAGGESVGTLERAAEHGLAVRRGLQNILDYELFVAQNSIEVGGKIVTGFNSVTVGKVLRAVTLFVLGVLISNWLGRGGEKIVVGRFGYDATRARILRKWLHALVLIVLLLLVLGWVNIPLTVFAFLGGAIAIGLGFGTQTILKNLISGLLLLFERPFQPGDLIEVGNLRGNLTEVGIRSSTIHDANGIDTLVPNSVFLEQNVTNWTYESSQVRFCILLGVAYGSPVDKVAQLLADCVAQHDHVLDHPEPEVFFDNFGPNALEFSVYFWLEINDKVSSKRVSSDLRFAIEKIFAAQGIVISYPQRDVHLDSAAPLKIELLRRRSPVAAADA